MQSSLLKPIYVSYALGDIDGKVIHDDPIQIYAQVEDVNSLVMREDVGIVQNYDRIIIVPLGTKTQFIDEQSLLWVNVEPNASRNNSDYKIERVGDVIDGNFILYCNSLTQNTKPLYYEYKGQIYQVKVDFDNGNLVAISPLNKYLPITQDTKVWTTKPVDTNSTKNLLRVVGIRTLTNSVEFKFSKVG